MYVKMTPLDAEGQTIIVDHFIDGWSTQYAGQRGDEYLFKTWDDPEQLLGVWITRATSNDANWQQHLTIALGE